MQTSHDPENMFPLQMEYVYLKDLQEWPGNPKEHDIPGIVDSIQAHGFRNPQQVDRATMRMLAGHGRKEALLLMYERGDNPPLGILVENGEWKVPVVYGRAFPSDRAAEAYVLADNKVQQNAGYRSDALRKSLERVIQRPMGLRGTGFTSEEVDSLIQRNRSTIESLTGVRDSLPKPISGETKDDLLDVGNGTDLADKAEKPSPKASLPRLSDELGRLFTVTLKPADYTEAMEILQKIQASQGLVTTSESFMCALRSFPIE